MSWGSLAAEINKIPPITRIALGSSVLIAAPLILKLMGPGPYAFNWSIITGKLQIHRLYTSFWVPWRLDAPVKWLFDMVMLYRHLKPIEEKSYHRRLPDLVWQFFWSMVAIQILCYPLHFPYFWTPLLGFIVYLSSRLSPNESISLYGLITLNVKWFPYILVAFDMVMSPMIGCGTIAGLIVAQVLFMLEFNTSEGNPSAEPTLRPQSKLRAPDWLSRLLVEPPQVQNTATVRTVYGNATAPANRGIGDLGQGANVPGSSGYQWGKGRKLGGT